MDKLVSTVIRRGGTVRPSSRAALDRVSPYLAKRVLGESSLPLQKAIKLHLDPNNVLMGDGHLFHQARDGQKSWVVKLREQNKQVNYYMTRFGL